MARRLLDDKYYKPLSGNNVSHSQIKTKRKFDCNLVVMTFLSESSKILYQLSIPRKISRTIDKHGGFDSFMSNIASKELSTHGKQIKKAILSAKAKVARN